MNFPTKNLLVFPFLIMILIVSACTPPTPVNLPPSPGDPLTGSGAVDRQALTYSELTSTSPDLTAPVEDTAFAIPAEAAAPTHTFEGILRLRNTGQTAMTQAIKDDYSIVRSFGGTVALPEFDFEFVQHGSHLIPARQGLIYTGHPFFNLIVGSGRAWNESADQGMTRATFPFTLTQRNQNCTFNGVMAFLFDDKTISQVRYQVTQETCPYFKVDLWGQVKGEYRPGRVNKSAEIIQQHSDELANLLPLKSLEALKTDFPEAGVDLTGMIKEYDAAHLTTYGVIVNGVHYSAGCATRHGAYAYCNQIRLASYSTAKSAFAGVALMRMGQKYGPAFYTLPIKDFISEAKRSDAGWSEVRIYHTIDMRTGMFRTGDDEGTSQMDAFIDAESFNDRLNAALNFPYGADPGMKFVYKTSDTFLGVLAMDKFLKKNEGGSADIFNMVRDEVYKPIHLTQGMLTTLRTDNKDSGSPVGGLGLFWSPEDVAKMTIFLNNENGSHEGKTILDVKKLGESFHRDRRGQPDPDNRNEYKSGFWAREFKVEEYPEYGCTFWIPHMSGFGGITIGMLPSGANFYLFSDNHEDPWEPMVYELNKVSPVCPKEP